MASESGLGRQSSGTDAAQRSQVSGGAPNRASWLGKAYGWFESRYGLDLRSLAAFRMGIGVLLLNDLAWRAVDLRAHYTDAGILTRERLVGGWGQPLFYSLHTVGGDRVAQAGLFLVAAVFAGMLLIGYRTRLAAFMSWLLLCSLQARNYIVLQGGDDMLRVMLFWAIFLPLNARFSVDAVLAKRRLVRANPASSGLGTATATVFPSRVLSLASATLVTQLLTVYFVSAALKTGPTWHRDGSAIQLALHHHAFATSFGQWFRELPTPILQGMTWQVWWLELCGPLLFFVPWGTYWWRTLQALLFMGFHFGLFLTMRLGHFPWVAIVCWAVVLPSWFWDQPLRRFTLAIKLRPKLRQWSQRAQTFIVEHERWFRGNIRLPRIQPTLAASFVVLVLASYTAYGTAYAMTHGGNVQGERFNPLLVLRLYANWGMFAPNPPNTSGWLVTVAQQKNGSEIDVWNGGVPVSFDPPALPSATYKRQRWRKFGDNILSPNHAGMRSYFLRYLCLDWNEDHPGPDAIEKITLYHMAQTANFPAKGYGPLSKNELARENCPPPPGEAAKPGARAQAKPNAPANKAKQPDSGASKPARVAPKRQPKRAPEPARRPSEALPQRSVGPSSTGSSQHDPDSKAQPKSTGTMSSKTNDGALPGPERRLDQ